MLPLQAPEIYPKTQQAKSNRVPKFKQSPIVTKCQQPKLSRPSFLLLRCSRCSHCSHCSRSSCSSCCSRCFRCYRCYRYSWPSPQPWPHQSAQKCRFCARNARKRGFQTPKAHKNPDFVLGETGIGTGKRGIWHREAQPLPSCKSPRTLLKYKYLIIR